jgi:hypothetical protein
VWSLENSALTKRVPLVAARGEVKYGMVSPAVNIKGKGEHLTGTPTDVDIAEVNGWKRHH